MHIWKGETVKFGEGRDHATKRRNKGMEKEWPIYLGVENQFLLMENLRLYITADLIKALGTVSYNKKKGSKWGNKYKPQITKSTTLY